MDSPLKQRLIGAVVLIALAVIFLPMLIKGPAPDSGVSDVSMKVPEEPAGDFVEIPLNAPGATPEGGAVGMPAGAPAPVKPETPAAAGSAAGSAAMLPPSTAAGDYAVSFGAYASQADADAVIARLKQAQLPGFRVADTINGRTAWRVRIGPYADRAQAEIVRLEAVKVRNDVNAQVIALDADAPTPAASTPQPAAVAAQPVRTDALPPEPAGPTPAKPEPANVSQQPQAARPEPAKPTAAAVAPKPAETPKPEPAKPVAPAAASTGFAVQLGAFSNAADANALRDRARAAGFSAIVDQVNTDKGTLSRVRVGPVATRPQAEQLRSQVAAKLGLTGQVRPHP
ncbi:MAG: SPOR domain-containing protein [Pseudoxanthomonas sp.]